MKRNLAVFFTVVVMILAALVGYPDAASTAQRKKPTRRLITWSVLGDCAHTVGDFSGKYTTKYTKVLGNLWLKQTYDFPPGQFGVTTSRRSVEKH